MLAITPAMSALFALNYEIFASELSKHSTFLLVLFELLLFSNTDT